MSPNTTSPTAPDSTLAAVAAASASIKRWLTAVYPQAWRLLPFYINHVVAHVPLNAVRVALLEWAGVCFVDRRTNAVMMGCQFYAPSQIRIGRDSVINRECRFDAGGTVTIGESSNISHAVRIQTGSHNIYSDDFEASYKPVIIGNHVWICEAALVIGGVTIGDGAVVMAGSVVTRDVEPWTIVGGVPARPVGVRPRVSYEINWTADFN